MELNTEQIKHLKKLYPTNYPNIGDTVATIPIDVNEYYVIHYLPEYDCTAILSKQEYTQIKPNDVKKHIKKLIKQGLQECMKVSDVDVDKKLVELTKTSLFDEDIDIFNEHYSRTKKLFTFFKRWSLKESMDLITTVFWELYAETENNRYINVTLDNLSQKNIPNNLINDFNNTFCKIIKNYELPFEVLCCTNISTLQSALNKYKEYITKDYPLFCTYTGRTGTNGSVYVLSVETTFEDHTVMEYLQKVVDEIKSLLV